MNLFLLGIYTYNMLKNCAKGKYKFIALAFKPGYEDQIIKSVFRYTTNFVILRTKRQIELNSCCVIYCDTDNIDSILGNISDVKEEYYTDNSCVNIFTYIVFMQTAVYPNIIFNNATTDEFINIYKSIKILSSMEKIYEVSTYVIYDDFLFLVFCDKDDVAEHKKFCTIFKDNIGIGDYFTIHSLRYEYYKKAANKNTYILSYDRFEDNFDCGVFEKKRELKYNNTKIINYWLDNFKNDYSATIQNFKNCNSCHIRDVWANLFNIHTDDAYKYSGVLKNIISDNIPIQEREYIDKLFEGKQYIGFQFFTWKQSEYNSELYYNDNRVWDEENVTSFMKLCHDNSIDIIVLSPHPYQELANYLHLPKMSVYSYAYAISKMKFAQQFNCKQFINRISGNISSST